MKASLDEFLEAVRDSVESHAKRKNYTDHGADGENKLVTIMAAMGIGVPHGIGEIVYKCTEYLRNPREVLLVKIAGWAFIIWRGEKDAGRFEAEDSNRETYDLRAYLCPECLCTNSHSNFCTHVANVGLKHGSD